MGKYMKKARGGRGVMEVITQGPSGVRTRARSQAMQEELVEGSNSSAKLISSTSVRSVVPAQISYLELRSRRLEKTVALVGSEEPATQKTGASASEGRRLSYLTNSENPAHESSSRLALSLDRVQHTRRLTGNQMYDENRQLAHPYHYGDNEVADESSFQGFGQRSLQQWSKRGVAPPGVAHSRSNSRSNSVTREFPSLSCERLSHGILTRNKSKLEKQISDTNARSDEAANLNVELELSSLCNAKAGNLVKNLNIKVSMGENPTEQMWSSANRGIQEETQSSNTKEQNVLPVPKDLIPIQLTYEEQAAPYIMQSPLDLEIEDFLSQAEQQLHTRFRDRYNFDPQNGIPLPGRYDWVEL